MIGTAMLEIHAVSGGRSQAGEADASRTNEFAFASLVASFPGFLTFEHFGGSGPAR
jgi:hypothetical protein